MKLAVVRVRGGVRVRHDIRKALDLIGLRKSNMCAVVEDSLSVRRMLDKVKDYATWGPVDVKVLAELKGAKVIHLNPPKKGFGRKGVKVPFKLSGALGDRKEKINDLIMRML